VRDLLACATGVVELSGSGEGDIEPGVVLALAGFGHAGCVLAGHDRAARGPVGVAGLRVLRRGIRLAAELRLPLITVIDTGGAELSQRAEEAGLAGQVSRCLIEMAQVAAPSVSVLLGQGAGGAAIALLPADRVIAAEHGWVAPVAPEGGSAIVHRDPGCAAEMARAQGIGAWDLRRNGIVDRIVAERGAQRGTPPGTGLAKRVALVLAEELGHLAAATSALPPERTRAVRHSRAARITRMMTERDEARPLRSGRTCPT
jgi:acetyl-CoA carboxylase carboxyl transferase subunit beta